MVREIAYSTMRAVLDSWEVLRQIPNYEQVAGARLFTHLFKECPEATALFGLANSDPSSKEVLESKQFVVQSSLMVQMLDTSLQLLGPDIEVLTEILLELGLKHRRYGVTADMFPIMGDALIATLKDLIKSEMTNEVTAAWDEVYHTLSSDLIRAAVMEDQQKRHTASHGHVYSSSFAYDEH